MSWPKTSAWIAAGTLWATLWYLGCLCLEGAAGDWGRVARVIEMVVR